MSKLKYGVGVTDSCIGLEFPCPMRGPFPEMFEKIARMGLDAAEIDVADPAKYNAAELRARLQENGLACCGLSTGLSLRKGCTLIEDDPGRRQAAVDTLKKYLDFGAELRGSVIVGTYKGFIPVTQEPERYMDYFRESMAALSAHAEKAGVTIALEAVNMYYTNYLNSAREMTRFVTEMGYPNVKVTLDTAHMILHDVDVYTRITECGRRIGYVHFSDSDRYACGTGNINFAEYIRGLRDIGYDGCCTIETVPYPNSERAVEVSLKYLKVLEECYELKYLEKPVPEFPRAFFG